MRTIVCILAVWLFSACATAKPSGESYEQRLAAWVGDNINNLIAESGAPTEVFPMDNGNKIYIWSTKSAPQSTTNYNAFFKSAYTTTYTYWCKTEMTADSTGKIINWRYSGNNCGG